MVGHTLGSALTELYFRVRELHSWELGLLLRRCGLYRRQRDFVSFLETVYRCRVTDRLPGSNFGFSMTLSPTGDASFFSLFTFADCVFGSDEDARERILELGRNQGLDLRVYDLLS